MVLVVPAPSYPWIPPKRNEDIYYHQGATYASVLNLPLQWRHIHKVNKSTDFILYIVTHSAIGGITFWRNSATSLSSRGAEWCPIKSYDLKVTPTRASSVAFLMPQSDVRYSTDFWPCRNATTGSSVPWPMKMGKVRA